MIINELWDRKSQSDYVVDVDFTRLLPLLETPINDIPRVLVQETPNDVPYDAWFRTVEFILENATSFGQHTLLESIADDRQMQNLRAWSVKNPRIGEFYVPVLTHAIGNNVKYFDIAGNWPPATKAKPCELIDITNNDVVFDVDGKVTKYPYRKSDLVDTLIFTPKDYSEFVTHELLKDRDLPGLGEDYSPINENDFDLGDLVEITGRVVGHGLQGRVRDIGRSGAFVVVDLGADGVRSFQASDVSRIDDDEDELDEHGGGIGPRQHWQKLMRETDTVNQMDQDELEDDTDLDEGVNGPGPNFIERAGDLILWQMGHYHYVITRGQQPFEVVLALPDTSHEDAQAILNQTAGVSESADAGYGADWEQHLLQEFGFDENFNDIPKSMYPTIINNAKRDGTISKKPVFKYTDSDLDVYFLTDNHSISAWIMLEGDNLLGMRSYDKGLNYALIQYLTDLKQKRLRIEPSDTFTDEGFNWVIDQIDRPNGFKITDLKNQPIDKQRFQDEFDRAKQQRWPGPTGVYIGESGCGKKLRTLENQNLFISDRYGVRLTKEQHLKMQADLVEELVAKGHTDPDLIESWNVLQRSKKQRLSERAGPVSVVRWGKPWKSAGGDGTRATGVAKQVAWSDEWSPGFKGNGLNDGSAKGQTTDVNYTQSNTDNQSDAHEWSDLETFYDYDDLDEFTGYDIDIADDPQGIQQGSDCELVNYTTAKPTVANTLAPDPEAPGASGAWDDDTDDTDEEIFGDTEPDYVSDPYDLGYPAANQTEKLTYPSAKQKAMQDQESSTVKTAERLAEAVEKISPNTVLEHTDNEILRACYEVADRHYGMKITATELGIMARMAIKNLREGS